MKIIDSALPLTPAQIKHGNRVKQEDQHLFGMAAALSTAMEQSADSRLRWEMLDFLTTWRGKEETVFATLFELQRTIPKGDRLGAMAEVEFLNGMRMVGARSPEHLRSMWAQRTRLFDLLDAELAAYDRPPEAELRGIGFDALLAGAKQ